MPVNARTGRTLSSCGMGLSRRTKLGSKCRRFRWWDQSGTDGRRAADNEAHKLGTCTLKGSELIARIRREKRICFRSRIVSALTSHVNDIAASVPLCDLVDLLLNFNSTFCANGDCCYGRLAVVSDVDDGGFALNVDKELRGSAVL
jgi:hypothetical protein